jgi:transcriptional regulator with XRE-family HTH domain
MENLKRILNERQIPYMRFARELGVTRQALDNWFRGKNYPSIHNLKKISQILNVDLTAIFPE